MAHDTPDILEALRAHQAELEVQNQELREVHQALEASRNRFRTLFEQAPVAYLLLDRKGRILEANVAAGQLLDAEWRLLPGLALPAFLDARGADALYLHLGEVIGRSGRAVLDLTLPLEERVEVRCESVRLDDHSLTALVDLSGIRRVEQRLRAITEAIDQVFYERGPDGALVYVSAAGRLPGWPDAVHPEDRERVQRLWSTVPEPTADEEYRVVTPDGRLRWVRERTFPRPATGRVVGVVRDITVERQLQASLREAQKMEAVATLASGVAHDFRNLLQGVMGCVQMASSQGTSEALATYLEPVLDGCRRGNRLVEQLLTFARETATQREAVRIDVLVARSIPLLRSLVGDEVELEVQLGAPSAVLRASPVELEQVLLNLAANARDAMPRGGRITLSTHGSDDGLVRIEVRDTGDGMDEATRARAFEPFFTTKEFGRGSGLGLSMVFGIVSDLGGRVAIDSAPGQGTTVSMALPRLDEAAEAGSGEPVALAGRVLLAEDEALVRATLRMYLRDLGLDMLAAPTGAEALAIAEREPIDLLLTDVSMPGLGGPALAERVRAIRPGVSVVFMSAHDPVELIERGELEPGAVVLSKPFDQVTLHAVLRGALAR